jgi:hypothetical protein
MDTRQLLLNSHGWVHSSSVTTEGRWHIEDSICAGLTADQMRICPLDTLNSIAWLLWHMARYEDVAVNVVLRGVEEVFDREGWKTRLGVRDRQVGTGDTPADVRLFNEKIDVATLRDYRAAVARETRSWMAELDLGTLGETVTREDVHRAVQQETFRDSAAWVIEYWQQGWTQGEFLSWLTTGHNFYHLGEARVTRGLVLLR